MAASLARGQWTSNGNDIYNTNPGKVGVGTNTPNDSSKFDVQGEYAKNGLLLHLDHLKSGNTGQTGKLLISSGSKSSPIWKTINEAIGGNAMKTNYLTRFNGSNLTYGLLYDNGSYVGIGTTSPAARLDIKTAATAGMVRGIRLMHGTATTQNNGVYIEFASSTSTGYGSQIGGIREGDMGANALVFKTGGNAQVERMRINNSGLIGIGTDNPAANLNIYNASDKALLLLERPYSDTINAPIALLQLKNSSSGNFFHIGYRHSNGSEGMVQSVYESLTNSWLGIFHFSLKDRKFLMPPGGVKDAEFANSGNFLIKNTGNVGIGTSSPSAKLTVYDAAKPATVRLENPYNDLPLKTIGAYTIRNSTTGDKAVHELRRINGNSEMLTSGYDSLTNTWRCVSYLNINTGKYEIRNGVNQVEYNNAGDVIFNNSGRIGVGTNTPATKVHVVSRDPLTSTLAIENRTGTGGAGYRMIDSVSNSDWTAKVTKYGTFKIRDNINATDVFTIEKNASANSIYIKTDQKVGINTTNPLSTLHVFNNDTTRESSLLIQNNVNSKSSSLRLVANNWQSDWDLSANQFNFFQIKDMKNGKNVFSIESNSNDSSLVIQKGGNIRIGQVSSVSNLNVFGTGNFTGPVSAARAKAANHLVPKMQIDSLMTTIGTGGKSWTEKNGVISAVTGNSISINRNNQEVEIDLKSSLYNLKLSNNFGYVFMGRADASNLKSGFFISNDEIGYQVNGVKRGYFPIYGGSPGKVLTYGEGGQWYWSDGGGSGSGDITAVYTNMYESGLTGGAEIGNVNLSVNVSKSINKVSNCLQLINDKDSPPLNSYYGTNSSSVKGWYPLPTQTTGGFTTAGLGLTSNGADVRLGTVESISKASGNTITADGHTHQFDMASFKLSDLGDVFGTDNPQTDQVLKWNGSSWAPGTDKIGTGTADNWGSQTVVTDYTLSGNGTSESPLKLGKNSATDGQVLKCNGYAWAPDTDLIGTGTADNWGSQTAFAEGMIEGNGLANNKLRLKNGTSDGQILKWNGSAWALGTDETGTGSYIDKYLKSVDFNTGTGDLNFSIENGNNLSVNLDSRYTPKSDNYWNLRINATDYRIDPKGIVRLSGVNSLVTSYNTTNNSVYFKLVNDESATGADMYYGIKNSARGWYTTPWQFDGNNLKTSSTNVIIGDDINLSVAPPDRLKVNGRILAHEVVVERKNWSDYVFNENYPLPKLSEVEQFINENKHLPDIPSEKTVVAEGVNLGEMNALLLKKIEELTLYSIQLEKNALQLEKRLKELEEVVTQIKR